MIAAAIEPAPDLRFVPEDVLVEGGLSGEARVAARLAFSCTPLRPFLGLPPHGAVHFTEPTFYRFLNGRLAEVWSLLDRATEIEQEEDVSSWASKMLSDHFTALRQYIGREIPGFLKVDVIL